MFPIPIPRGGCELQDEMLQLAVGNGKAKMGAARWKPTNLEPPPNCPRCASPNTKFCYYNNYSLSQPRYFCKACRRYWTKGGFLRNIPVGGGSRKSRRNSPASRASPSPPIHHLPRSLPNHQSEVSTASESDHIDMALVFSKFLSSGQDSISDQATATNEVSNSSSNSKLCLAAPTPESVEAESDAPQPSDYGPPRPQDSCCRVQNCAEEALMSGIDELEWEGLLGNAGGDDHEVVQDVFWSDATTSSMMHLQEDLVDYPIPFNYDNHIEDADADAGAQLHITDATWTWSSFDFSTLHYSSHHQLQHLH